MQTVVTWIRLYSLCLFSSLSSYLCFLLPPFVHPLFCPSCLSHSFRRFLICFLFPPFPSLPFPPFLSFIEELKVFPFPFSFSCRRGPLSSKTDNQGRGRLHQRELHEGPDAFVAVLLGYPRPNCLHFSRLLVDGVGTTIPCYCYAHQGSGGESGKRRGEVHHMDHCSKWCKT